MTSEITVSELQAKGPDIELIDVRTPAEYAAIRVPFAKTTHWINSLRRDW